MSNHAQGAPAPAPFPLHRVPGWQPSLYHEPDPAKRFLVLPDDRRASVAPEAFHANTSAGRTLQ